MLQKIKLNLVYFLQHLQLCSQLDNSSQLLLKENERAARSSLKYQLWYLSKDLAALPLFSDKISVEEKMDIVNALQNFFKYL